MDNSYMFSNHHHETRASRFAPHSSQHQRSSWRTRSFRQSVNQSNISQTVFNQSNFAPKPTKIEDSIIIGTGGQNLSNIFLQNSQLSGSQMQAQPRQSWHNWSSANQLERSGVSVGDIGNMGGVPISFAGGSFGPRLSLTSKPLPKYKGVRNRTLLQNMPCFC
jgi:hypothetical protein